MAAEANAGGPAGYNMIIKAVVFLTKLCFCQLRNLSIVLSRLRFYTLRYMGTTSCPINGGQRLGSSVPLLHDCYMLEEARSNPDKRRTLVKQCKRQIVEPLFQAADDDADWQATDFSARRLFDVWALDSSPYIFLQTVAKPLPWRLSGFGGSSGWLASGLFRFSLPGSVVKCSIDVVAVMRLKYSFPRNDEVCCHYWVADSYSRVVLTWQRCHCFETADPDGGNHDWWRVRPTILERA